MGELERTPDMLDTTCSYVGMSGSELPMPVARGPTPERIGAGRGSRLGSAVAQIGAPGIVRLVTDTEAVSTLGAIPRGHRERGGFSASGASAVAGVGLDRFDPLIVVPA